MRGCLQVARRDAGVITLAVMVCSISLVTERLVAGQTRAAVDAGPQVLAQRVSAGTWDTFSTRITVRREWLSARPVVNGQAVSTPAGVLVPTLAPLVDEYVWERRKTATGWRSRMTIVSETAPVVQGRLGSVTLPGDRGIAWMEDAEDGSLPRFFAKNGSELVLPSGDARERLMPAAAAAAASAASAAASGLDADMVGRVTGAAMVRPTPGREWVRSFVLLPEERQRRMTQVSRRFGQRAGWVRGYGQYIRAVGTQSIEWLVDEQDGVPVEVNVTEAGQLRLQTRLTYERAASGALLRRGVRVERALPAVDGSTADERAVTDITYSDVRLLTTGGGR